MSSPSRCTGSAVYPRWRGEHPRPKYPSVSIAGLSPLARGTPSEDDLPFKTTRFIPAGAGNTYACRVWEIEDTVYPRWRGEHMVMRWGLLRRDGLSPLARGTLQITIGSDVHYRFIPAGAGNTLRVTDLPGKPTVYPRWRGEHVSIPNIKPLQFGLSPLARGTLTVEHCRVIEMRFIPAGAGNTHRNQY